jgi:hypothetical protein
MRKRELTFFTGRDPLFMVKFLFFGIEKKTLHVDLALPAHKNPAGNAGPPTGSPGAFL